MLRPRCVRRVAYCRPGHQSRPPPPPPPAAAVRVPPRTAGLTSVMEGAVGCDVGCTDVMCTDVMCTDVGCTDMMCDGGGEVVFTAVVRLCSVLGKTAGGAVM